MSAHVLLYLLNELGWGREEGGGGMKCEAFTEIKCEALSSILSGVPNEFNTFNNTGARMQDSS